MLAVLLRATTVLRVDFALARAVGRVAWRVVVTAAAAPFVTTGLVFLVAGVVFCAVFLTTFAGAVPSMVAPSPPVIGASVVPSPLLVGAVAVSYTHLTLPTICSV